MPEPMMLVGFSDAVSPAEGVGDRVTVPAKPFKAEIVIVVVHDEPAVQLKLSGLDGARAKSWTVKETTTECVNEPLVPVTVTV